MSTFDKVVRVIVLTLSIIGVFSILQPFSTLQLKGLKTTFVSVPCRNTGGAMPHFSMMKASELITRSSIRDTARVAEMTSNNRHMVYLPKPRILLVTMAKAGSSTLYHWLFRGLVGKDRWDNKACGSHIHDKTAKCWEGEISTLHTLPIKQQYEILTDDSVFRLAIQRHPYERLVSAFKSKFTCEDEKFSTDTHERTNMIFNLVKFLPNAPENNVRHYFNAGFNKTCLTIDQFARILHKVQQMNNVSVHELDEHIKPQNFFFDEIEYKMILDVNHLSDINMLQPVIDRLPYKELVKGGIKHRHSSGSKEMYISESAATLLHDFAMLSRPGPLKTPNNSSHPIL